MIHHYRLVVRNLLSKITSIINTHTNVSHFIKETTTGDRRNPERNNSEHFRPHKMLRDLLVLYFLNPSVVR